MESIKHVKKMLLGPEYKVRCMVSILLVSLFQISVSRLNSSTGKETREGEKPKGGKWGGLQSLEGA